MAPRVGAAGGLPEGLPGSLRVVLDRRTRVLGGGGVLVGGTPLRVLRLSGAGRAVLRQLAGGAAVEAAGPGAAALARRLLDAGLAHPRPAGDRYAPGDVTVVVPARDAAAGLAALLPALGPAARVVVVDDGSRDGSGEVAAGHGAAVLRHPTPRGPAAARNAGLRAAGTPVVAFVDADCAPAPGWLGPLLAHLDDPAVAVVAPRVVAAPGDGVLDRFEAARSPLDLGAHEGLVAPGGPRPYAPSAALVVRRAAVAAAGGFAEALRVGEDVDLLWRLADAGWAVRYEPRSRVVHRHGRRLRALVARRADYGSSAALLAARHPGRMAALRTSWASAGVLAAAAGGHPGVAAAVAVASVARLRRRMASVGPVSWGDAAAIAAGGHLAAAAGTARAVTRTWLPLAGALVAWPRARPALAAAVLLPPLAEWAVRRPRLDPLRYEALVLLDDAAYCAGVWRGCAAARDPAPLLPALPRARTR